MSGNEDRLHKKWEHTNNYIEEARKARYCQLGQSS